MTELLRGNKRMNPTPTNLGEKSLIANLLGGSATLVRLEPGDATRYELIVCLMRVPHYDPVHRQLVITRLAGDMPYKTFVLDPWPFDTQSAAEGLSNGNEWSAELLTWWINWLVRKLGMIR